MRRFFSMPIRVQLFMMAVIVALPAAMIVVYVGLDHRRDVIREAHTSTKLLADDIAGEQKSLVAGVEQLVNVLAQLPEVRNRDGKRLQSTLSDVLRINPQLLNIYLVDQAGLMWISAIPSSAAISIADRRHFNSARATGRFSSGEYIVGRLLGKPTLSFGYPYTDREGVFAGVIVVNLDLEYSRKVLERSKLPPGSSYILVDHRGIILSRGLDQASFIGKPCSAPLFERFRRGGGEASFVAEGIDGLQRFISYRKMFLAGEDAPYLYVSTSIPYDSVVAQANRTLLTNLLLLIPFILLSLYLAWFIGRRSIVDPVGWLRQASQRLAAGDLQVRVSDRVGRGELGDLARAFDEMTAALERDRWERERAEQALHEQARMLEQEVAERQRAQEELALQQKQLEALNHSLEERIASSIRDLRHKDQMLIQQSRQAAMGEMINNIAHQWRQPLNNLGLILQNMVDGYGCGDLTCEEMRSQSAVAMDTIMFMSRTIDDFRFFFRQDKEKRRFRVDDTLNRIVTFTLPSLKHGGIAVDIDAVETVEAFGYPNEYSQVLLNIINNARDALLDARVADPRIRIRLFSEQGKPVVTVRDNGTGIEEAVLPRIFDPYFSTKEQGKGTGIGLYMSKVIIEQNMGGLLTAGNVGGGAEFRIELPAA